MLSIVVAEIQSCHLTKMACLLVELRLKAASFSLFAWVHDLIFEC